jgi:hypothetical protein
MEALNELNEAVKSVIEISRRINDETNAEVWEKAPLIIHQRFCHELVEVMKEKPKSLPKDIPEAMDILTAIRVIEKVYPKLSKS